MGVIRVPEILLPGEQTDLTKWSVVACDQFTSEPKYWNGLKAFVGSSPSMLNITFPEIYLKDGDADKRIESINHTMKKYLDGGIFAREVKGFVLTVRSTPYSDTRVGLMAEIDLEEYGYNDGDRMLVRATEGTVMDRIPPRVRIREKAPLESPHIMMLIDDPDRSVIEPLYAKRHLFEKLYDFELNMGGGHVRGYLAEDSKSILASFERLLSDEVLIAKYGRAEKFLLAAGDGNHSLATAKTCWERIKSGLSERERETHPARYALVEIVNVYDEGLKFEPIHRVVFGASGSFVRGLKERVAGYEGEGLLITGGAEERIPMPENAVTAVRVVQSYIDECIAAGSVSDVDYVHGRDSVATVVSENPACVGVILPAMDKRGLFPAVLDGGSLPRKTFSMGEAAEKRYYLEARRIKPNTARGQG